MKKYIAIIFYIVLCAAFAQSSEYTYEAVIHDRQAKQQPSLLSLNKQTLDMVRMASPDDDLAIETWERIVKITEQKENGEISNDRYEMLVNSALERLNRKREAQNKMARQQQAAEAQADYARSVIYGNMLRNQTISTTPRTVNCVTTGYGNTATTNCY